MITFITEVLPMIMHGALYVSLGLIGLGILYFTYDEIKTNGIHC